MGAVDLAVVARATGLATHLASSEALARLASAADLLAFVREVKRLGLDVDPIAEHADIADVDRAIGRTAARHLRTLARWETRRPGVLEIVIADLDRRTLRALLRGAVEGAPVASRVDGLVPTWSLPLRAISRMSQAASPAAVVAELTLIQHPDAARLRPLVREGRPDLLAVDAALLQGFADRAGAAARRSDAEARAFVSDTIDATNLRNAWTCAATGRDVGPDACFIGGGRLLTRGTFVEAARSSSAEAALAVLRKAASGTPLAGLARRAGAGAAAFDRAVLADRLDRLTVAARRNPLGNAPLLLVLTRLEVQSRDLRSLAWGAVLGAPADARRQALVRQ